MATRVHGKQKRQLRAYLIRRDGPFCGACGEPGYTDASMRENLKYLTVGHIVSAADGGRMSRQNSQLEHRDCNIKRGTEPLHVTARRRLSEGPERPLGAP